MKRSLLLTFFISFILLSSKGYGQAITSALAGPWNQTTTWTGGVIPTAANSTSITIQHNVNIPNLYTATVDQVTVNFGNTLTVDVGGTLDLQSSGGTDLTLTEDLIIFFIGANLVVNGDFINRSVTALNLGAGLSTTTFGSVGTVSRYEHNINGGTIPNSNVTWNTTSTCEITGVTNAVPAGLNQTFGNLTWNSSGTTGNLALALTSSTINGNFSILDTNSPNVVTLAGTNGTVDINGNFIVSGNSRFVGTSISNVTLDVEGDFNFSSTGVLSLLIVQTGTFDFNLGGDFAVTSGTVQAYAVPTATSNVTFDGSSSQSFNTSGGALTNNINWTLKNGSTTNTIGNSAFVNGGTFALEAGGTLGVGSADGLVTGTTNGNVRVSGTRTYTANGNIIYNGTAAQDLGDEWGGSGALNAVAVNLEIDNTNGVTNNIIGSTSLVGDLTLTTGALSIGISNSLDVESNFNVTGGSIGGLVSSNLTFSGSGTMDALSMASGAENLNNLTITRSGDLTLASDLTIAGTLSLTGNLDFSGASARTLTLNGTMSGVGGLKSNNNSNLEIGGTGAFGSITYAGSGNQLNNLTLARTASGTYTWGSTVTINNVVNLNFGTLTHSSGLTMATDATFVRDAGTIVSNSPITASSYNVTYTGGDKTVGLELPSSSSALNDLTVNASGTITLAGAIQVNGDLLLDGGTFSVGPNNFTMAGTSWTANGGLFSINAANSTIFTGTTTMSGSSIGGTQLGSLTINGGAVLNAPAANINVSGTWSNSGTFNSGTGEVTFNGTGQTINTLGTTFNDVDILGTVTLSSAIDVNGDLQITSSLDVSAGDHNINVGGTWENLGSLNPRAGTVIFDGANQAISSNAKAFFSLTVAGSGTTTLSDELTVNGDLTINSGSNLSVGISNNDIILAGNWISDGSFSAGLAKVILSGTDVQDIDGSTITSFNNIDIGNTSTLGVRVESDQNLTGTLTITTASSKFDADGTANTSIFTLVSADDDPATDGNIAALTTPANFTGDVTVQRYMSSEGGIWRYLTSPVSGLTVADWQGEFPITGGFTGADVLAGANLPSLYVYDETNTGGVDEGWLDYPDTLLTNAEPITPGVGYSAFIRAAAGQTTVDQVGPINKGNFNFSVSFTTGLGASDDGWNLLGNPYPSALDWDALWNDGSTASINSTSYVKDNGGGGGVFATFNASTGTGTNGGTKNIAQGQAFWVQANNSGTPTLIATESMKTTDTHEFFRISPPVNYLRIALNDGVNSDETLIHFFDDAEPMEDKYDAYKLKNDLFNLSTLTNEGKDMVINALKTIDCESNMSLNITNIEEGNYSLNFSELNSFTEAIELYLVDNFVGGNIKIVNEQIYDFEVTADEASYGADRFTILFSEPSINTELVVQGSDICDSQNAVVSIEASEIDVTYVLFKGGVQISDPATGNGGTLELGLTNLGNVNGEYEIDVRGDSGCGSVSLTNKAIVTLEGLYTVDQVEGDQSCSPASLTVSATGAPVDGAYRWYETESSTTLLAETSVGEYMTPVLNNSTNYFVSIVNSLGCEGERSVVEAVIINLDIPIVELDTLEHGVYQLVSSAAQGNQWFLNGVALSGATANTLVITEPGTYSVTVEQNGCMVDSDDYDYNDLVTGLSDELNDVLIGIAPNPFTNSFELHIPGERFNLKKTEITIFDINGKIVYLNKKVKSEIISIALREIKNGIYLINIYDGETGVQHKLVKE